MLLQFHPPGCILCATMRLISIAALPGILCIASIARPAATRETVVDDALSGRHAAPGNTAPGEARWAVTADGVLKFPIRPGWNLAEKASGATLALTSRTQTVAFSKAENISAWSDFDRPLGKSVTTLAGSDSCAATHQKAARLANGWLSKALEIRCSAAGMPPREEALVIFDTGEGIYTALTRGMTALAALDLIGEGRSAAESAPAHGVWAMAVHPARLAPLPRRGIDRVPICLGILVAGALLAALLRREPPSEAQRADSVYPLHFERRYCFSPDIIYEVRDAAGGRCRIEFESLPRLISMAGLSLLFFAVMAARLSLRFVHEINPSMFDLISYLLLLGMHAGMILLLSSPFLRLRHPPTLRLYAPAGEPLLSINCGRFLFFAMGDIRDAGGAVVARIRARPWRGDARFKPLLFVLLMLALLAVVVRKAIMVGAEIRGVLWLFFKFGYSAGVTYLIEVSLLAVKSVIGSPIIALCVLILLCAFKMHFQILDREDKSLLEIEEEGRLKVVVRKIFGHMWGLLRTNYVLSLDGREVGRLRRERSLLNKFDGHLNLPEGTLFRAPDQIRAQAAPSPRVCPACHATADMDAGFCDQCANPLPAALSSEISPRGAAERSVLGDRHLLMATLTYIDRVFPDRWHPWYV